MIVKPSRKKFINSYFAAAALPLLIPFLNSEMYAFASALLSIGLLLRAELGRARVKYILNGNELVHEVGIIRKNKSITRLLRVSQFNVSQSIRQKLLNYGTILLDTWGQPLKFEDVSNPYLLVERLKEMQKDNEL